MKKSRVIASVVVLAMAGSLFIPPVQTFAVNAMGVFRVSDPNVINISAQDLTEIAQNVQALKNGKEDSGAQTDNGEQSTDKQKMADRMRQYETVLNSASDFKAFSFSLPTYFKDQAPTIKEIDLPAKTTAIDTAKANQCLAELQSAVTLPESLNGRQATVNPSPMIVAEYPDAICFAAQKPTYDLPGNLESLIAQAVTTLPLLTDDIRSQLGNISLFDKNIYLLNVEGVTKTADLGGNTGYIYAVNDVTTLAGNLSSTSQSDKSGDIIQKLQEYAGYEVILWVSDGTLYGVSGKYSDDQLAAIAKSMR